MSIDPRSLIPLLALALAGCPVGSPVEDDDDSAAANDDDSAGDDDDSVPQLPPDPFPFNVDVAGASTATVTVESNSGCQNFTGSSNFRQQMAAGQWVLRIAVDGSYDGAGIYDQAAGASVVLQDNTSGGAFYQANGASGDTVTVEMEVDDGTEAWGTVTVSGLGGGAVTISPNVLPIWCPNVVH